MLLTADDLTAIWLTIKLALITTMLLMIFASPLAWWLSKTRSRLKAPINALISLPLVLPPTVLGFYLLLAMGPNGPVGQLMNWLGWQSLAFTFEGLIVASMIYSLPFVAQPLISSMSSVSNTSIELAKTMGAGPFDRFCTVVIPQCRTGFIIAGVLGFAHTLGEFGVVLMIGGNIPGETKVISVELYDLVESLDYARAHALALTLLVFSFVVLLLMYWSQGRRTKAPVGF